MTTTANECKLIGKGHFVGHLDDRLSEKKQNQSLNQSLMEAIHIMKVGRNPIQNDKVRVTTTADGQMVRWTDRRTS